jgi:phosphogluconate dehydratase
VFETQEQLLAAFKAGELERDFIAVVRFQGPRAERHARAAQADAAAGRAAGQGFPVALVTDGRMSGASGKVPAAIHVSPEVLAGGRSARCATAT